MAENPKVLILGAGFAGLGAARKLKDAPVDIILIDKNNYHTFQPLLYQVASMELGPSEVGFPVRQELHGQKNFIFHQASVSGVDLSKKLVTVEGMEPIPYDYLVVAMGAVVNFYGTKGAAENAFPLYTLRDAIRLKEHIIKKFEEADKNPAVVEDGALTFCIVGGGPTGVETAGALAGLFRGDLKQDFPNLPSTKFKIYLFEQGPVLLSPYKPKLQKYAERTLKENGVNVRTGVGVTEIEPTRLHLATGEVMEAHTVVWGAGVQANPSANLLGIEQEKGGRISVNLDLTLHDHPEVYIVGDIADIPDAKTKKFLPGLGSVALQSGQHAGENIAHVVKGGTTQPFKYLDKGMMAMVAHGSAVAQLPKGPSMTGHLGWASWLGVHLLLLSGGEQKSSTLVDWGINLLTHNRTKRIITSEDEKAVAQQAPITD